MYETSFEKIDLAPRGLIRERCLFNKIDFRGGDLNGRGGYSAEGAYSVIYGR